LLQAKLKENQLSLENRLRLLFWPIGKNEFKTAIAERNWQKRQAEKGAAKETPLKNKAAPLKPDAE
jgi:hypothetical protein